MKGLYTDHTQKTQKSKISLIVFQTSCSEYITYTDTNNNATTVE